MAFYLQPPDGNIPIEKLASFSLKRLKFLLKFVDQQPGDVESFHEFVSSYTSVEDSECLIEGTTKDKVSHFTLRLAACHSGNPSLQEFFIRAETLLFKFRLQCMDEKELYRLFKSFRRNRLQLDNNVDLSETSDQGYMTEMFQTFHRIPAGQHWKHLIRKYKDGVDDEYFQVPFEFTLNLVKHRQVRMSNGFAFVPYSKLDEVIVGLFNQSLVLGLKKGKRQNSDQNIIPDDRLKRIFNDLQATFSRAQVCNTRQPGVLHHQDVDELSRKFPLCMLNLHNELRVKHRLGHHARIQYTLFLKEAGMHVNEALLFWGQEYSKPVGGGSPCKHTWQKDARRYTYNIRHLYGLEGSRINYRGHSCEAIQGMTLQCRDEGGCPFRHFDNENLKSLLSSQCAKYHMVDDITTLASQGQYTNACTAHLKMKLFERDTDSGKHGINSDGKYMQSEHIEINQNKLDTTSAENDLIRQKVYSEQSETNEKFKRQLFLANISNEQDVRDDFHIEPSQGFVVADNNQIIHGEKPHPDESMNDSCYYSQDQTYTESLCSDSNLNISTSECQKQKSDLGKCDSADITHMTGAKKQIITDTGNGASVELKSCPTLSKPVEYLFYMHA
ncbi:unnamed protein product [Owenia fusiformis]|uniref:DNA primase large subunit C-terminal domain-containing protein n=1 Tax=Owenia fusiformis TaxID=6347 RepID=A0A8J1XS02_OWEFU|nr:unnamed protein product [Owenia fusiformis]